jgi:hypothetical protein
MFEILLKLTQLTVTQHVAHTFANLGILHYHKGWWPDTPKDVAMFLLTPLCTGCSHVQTIE